MDDNEEKAQLRDLLRKARAMSSSEIKNDDWRGAFNRWNDIIAEMRKVNKKVRERG